jgi:hypothetical protein
MRSIKYLQRAAGRTRKNDEIAIVHIIHLTIQLSGNLVVVKEYYDCV